MDVIFWSQTVEHWGSLSRYIGPYKISHWVKKFGYQSQVIDFVSHFTEEELFSITNKFITKDTLIIGISTTFLMPTINVRSTKQSSLQLPIHVINVAKKIKKEYPNIKFIIGGYSSDYIYLDDFADATVMSYTEASEDIFLELLEHYRKGTPAPYRNLEIKKFGEKEIKRPHFYKAREKKYNIEFDDFRFTKQDAILTNEPLPLDVSRGCIFACRFCKYPHLGKNKLDYIRGMNFIQEEIQYYYDKFDTTNYMILDDTFNDTVQKMNSFYNMTKSLNFNINYTAYLRADLIHRFPETAFLLKESGLWGAYHGLESLHPNASNIVGKAWSGKHAREFIPKLFHDYWKKEVPQLLAFIIGLPKESRDDVIETVKWFKENQLWSISFSKLYLTNIKKTGTAIPSEFEKNAEKYGFVFTDTGWHNDVWNNVSVGEVYNEVYELVNKENLTKNSVWNLGTLEMSGYDKNYLMNASINNMDWSDFKSRVAIKVNEYKRLLSEL